MLQFVLVFVFIAPVIAIAGVSAGRPWAELSVAVAGGLVAYASIRGLRAVLKESALPWRQRDGLQMRVIAGLAMVAVIGVLLGLGALAMWIFSSIV